MGGKDAALHAEHDSGWCAVPENGTKRLVPLPLFEADFGRPVGAQIDLADPCTTDFRDQRTILRRSSLFRAIFKF